MTRTETETVACGVPLKVQVRTTVVQRSDHVNELHVQAHISDLSFGDRLPDRCWNGVVQLRPDRPAEFYVVELESLFAQLGQELLKQSGILQQARLLPPV